MAYTREDDLQLIQDYKEGMSWKQLQSKYECSVTTIHDVLVRYNIERRRFDTIRWPQTQDELFKKMYLENCTYEEIGKTFGIKSSTITWHVHRLNLPMRGSGRNNVYPNKFAEDTPEAHYWLGYIFADGHVAYRKRNKVVSLYSEKKYVVDALREWFGEGVYVYSKEYTTKKGEVRQMYQASIHSSEIADWFHNDLNIPTKKHHTLNPNITLDWDIVRGYFEGDGSMSAERYLSFKSCSKVWLERIQGFLATYGIASSVKLSYNDCYGLFIYELENLEKMLLYMYKHPYYFHEYKHTNLVNRVAAMRRRKSGELLEA